MRVPGILQIFHFTGGQVVDNGDPCALFKQGVHQVRADETGSAGDQGMLDGFRHGNSCAKSDMMPKNRDYRVA
jgi:hypothetical protein